MVCATSLPEEREDVVATIAGTSEIDHAIAKLVFAFARDPVARWMYDDPHQIYCTYPGYFVRSGLAPSKREQRNAPATASASRFGFRRACAVTMSGSRRLLLKASPLSGKPRSTASSSGLNAIVHGSRIGICR